MKNDMVGVPLNQSSQHNSDLEAHLGSQEASESHGEESTKI